jgi:hypothetical protein
MSFAIANLALLSGANGFNLWLYRSADAIATVNSSGYFTGDAVNMLGVRDVILVIDTATPTTNWVNVLSNDGTTVDVSDGTAIVETDGD